MSHELKGKVAFVTGGSRGLGRAIALKLAGAGAYVAVVDLKETWAQGTCDIINSAGGASEAIGLDVVDREAFAAAVQRVSDEQGRFDILVNNAMWAKYESIPDVQSDTVDRMVDVGLKGVIWGMLAASGPMEKTGGGSIINVASVSGLVGLPNSLVYCGVKAGVMGLTRSSAAELGPHGIRVNDIAPGTVLTDGIKANVSEEKVQSRLKSTPLRRHGLPEDIADLALFLASDNSRHITGQSIAIDGGLSSSFLG